MEKFDPVAYDQELKKCPECECEFLDADMMFPVTVRHCRYCSCCFGRDDNGNVKVFINGEAKEFDLFPSAVSVALPVVLAILFLLILGIKSCAHAGEILAQAEIPIVGLTIVNGVPLINGRPIGNLSDGEKLELCIQVAAEREGSIQLLLLDGMEKLAAEEDRNRIYKTLKKKGVQFIAALATNDDKLTVVEL